MKAIVFAGGVGTRLWPLSRKKSPKQFEKVIGDKSTLQLAVERLLPEFSWEDIYISTAKRYTSQVKEQLPKAVLKNIIGEPESRDVGPAVGLSMAILHKYYPITPIVILWSDHLIKKIDQFKNILKASEKIILKNKNQIIFITQKPRFPSQNLGWIKYGKEVSKLNKVSFLKFENFNYRPDLINAEVFFKSGKYAWNIGYFVTTPAFLWKMYEKYQPEMFFYLKEIKNSLDSSKFKQTLNKYYPKMAKLSFDNAVLENIEGKDALVVNEDLGWSDVGAWEALKEALQTSPDQNVIQGKVLVTDSKDSLIYNYTDQLVVTIDLNGYLVINTNDVVLVCHKNSVPKIKKLVENLAKSENEHLI